MSLLLRPVIELVSDRKLAETPTQRHAASAVTPNSPPTFLVWIHRKAPHSAAIVEPLHGHLRGSSSARRAVVARFGDRAHGAAADVFKGRVVVLVARVGVVGEAVVDAFPRATDATTGTETPRVIRLGHRLAQRVDGGPPLYELVVVMLRDMKEATA